MKKTARLLSLFLCLAMLLPLLSGQLLFSRAYNSDTDIAYAVEGGNLYFNKATGTITDCDQTVTAAAIPAIIDGVAVVEIGMDAFYYCDKLTSVTIPKSVTELGYSPFGWCLALTGIWVDKDNPSFSSDAEGNLYSKDQTILYVVPAGRSGDFVISNHVTTIAESAFSSCKKITSITIPSSVTNIEGMAFFGCDSLTNIVIPNSVKKLGFAAFSCSEKLKSVTLPQGITEIEFGMFSSCTALTNVTIPSGVTLIGFEAFMDCPELKSVVIPQSVTMIEKMAFYLCPALADVYYDGTEAMWNNITVEENNEALLNAKIHFGQTPPAVDPPSNIPFGDVKESDYFAQPVLWAVEKGITNGTSAGKFSPERTCTRGQIVTFLWRAAGSPEPKTTDNPFSDVAADAYYYKAVLWAVENGITTGTGKGKFSPENTCTRGQVATFLWRAQGEPAPETTTNPFGDVAQNAYYYNAVLWAVEQEITNGTGKGLFSPDKDCTRGQIVTFLYRAMA